MFINIGPASFTCITSVFWKERTQMSLHFHHVTPGHTIVIIVFCSFRHTMRTATTHILLTVVAWRGRAEKIHWYDTFWLFLRLPGGVTMQKHDKQETIFRPPNSQNKTTTDLWRKNATEIVAGFRHRCVVVSRGATRKYDKRPVKRIFAL